MDEMDCSTLLSVDNSAAKLLLGGFIIVGLVTSYIPQVKKTIQVWNISLIKQFMPGSMSKSLWKNPVREYRHCSFCWAQ